MGVRLRNWWGCGSNNNNNNNNNINDNINDLIFSRTYSIFESCKFYVH